MKQPNCLSIDGWIKQLGDIYTMEFYLVTKKKKVSPFGTEWMDLENIMLSEISQSVVPWRDSVTSPSNCVSLFNLLFTEESNMAGPA